MRAVFQFPSEHRFGGRDTPRGEFRGQPDTAGVRRQPMLDAGGVGGGEQILVPAGRLIGFARKPSPG